MLKYVPFLRMESEMYCICVCVRVCMNWKICFSMVDYRKCAHSFFSRTVFRLRELPCLILVLGSIAPCKRFVIGKA